MPRTYKDFTDQIIRVFPDALIHALNEYENFLTKEIVPGGKQTEAKSIYEFHNACKSIISHMELLLKLAKILGLPDAKLPDQNGQVVLAGVMQEAEEELQNYRQIYSLPTS
jgi:hypothetical protein